MVTQKPLPSIVDAHFRVIRDVVWTPYGAEGLMPVSWADLVLNRWDGFDLPLPARRQSRIELRAYCQDPVTPPMHAFIAVMAWGVHLPRSRKFREAVQDKQDLICDMMTAVIQGMPRADAYDLWKGKVWGLGPSFFTKLLAFMCPLGSMAIMDQWTAKAVNLLYQSEVVRLAATKPGLFETSPCNSNTGRDYERYCLHLEDLQHRLKEASLSATEERIFSRAGEGTWRAHVVEHWKPVVGRRGGSRERMTAIGNA